jgi:hypothetical protein
MKGRAAVRAAVANDEEEDSPRSNSEEQKKKKKKKKRSARGSLDLTNLPVQEIRIGS